MTQPLPNNWLNLGAIVIGDDGTVYPRRPYLKLVGTWTIADDPANQATDLTPPTLAQAPDVIVSVVGVALGTTVQATLYAVHEVHLTSGTVEIDCPAGMTTPGMKFRVKILAGDPSVNALLIKAPAGKSIEGMLGTPRLPGDYSSQTLLFNQAGQIGQEMTFRVNGAGNVSSS